MFEALRVKNFRSIQDSGAISFSKLNVLVGPNNSGKSSVLAILLLLKQSLSDDDPSTPLVTAGPLVDLGSYLDMVGSNPEHNPLVIDFRLARDQLGPLPTFVFETAADKPKAYVYNEFSISFLYDKKADEVRVTSFDMKESATGHTISGTHKAGGWKLEGIPEDIAPHIALEFFHFLPVFLPTGKRPDDQTVNRAMAFSLASQINAQHLRGHFEHLSYVGPIRERIPRYGMLGTMPYSEITPSGHNLMRVLTRTSRSGKRRRLPIKQLDYWLDKKFKLLKHVRMKKLDPGGTVRALIADEKTGKARINLAATGSGISQIVPVVVQTVLTLPKGCLIVEQPEVHLHPAAQTVLADLFVERLKQGPQYILETHSEHLVLRLRRRIAEGKIKPADVRIIYVEKKEGLTSIRPLELNSNGHFSDWPEGFFEEGYQEALALAEASQKRASDAN